MDVFAQNLRIIIDDYGEHPLDQSRRSQGAIHRVDIFNCGVSNAHFHDFTLIKSSYPSWMDPGFAVEGAADLGGPTYDFVQFSK